MTEKQLQEQSTYAVSFSFFRKLFENSEITLEDFRKIKAELERTIAPIIPSISINELDNRGLKSDVCNEVSL